MLVENSLAALGVGGGELGAVVDENEFGETHVVEEGVAAGDVEDVDGGGGEGAAVEFEFDLGPIGVAAADDLGFETGAVEVEADAAGEGVGFDPTGEAVLGVGLERDVGVEAGVGVAAGADAEGLLAAVDFLGGGDEGPCGGGVAFAGAIVAAGPARGETVGAGDFEAGVGEEIRAFAIERGAVDLAEEAGGLAEPLVTLVGGIADEGGDDGLDLRGRGELGELGEGGEAREGVGIADDSGGEVEGDGGSVAPEGAGGVAADGGVGGAERGAVGGLVEPAETVERPEGVEGGKGGRGRRRWI